MYVLRMIAQRIRHNTLGALVFLVDNGNTSKQMNKQDNLLLWLGDVMVEKNKALRVVRGAKDAKFMYYVR